MLTILVDYSTVGHSHAFSTRLYAEERELLHVGDIVKIAGDDVEERHARVTRIDTDEHTADFVFLTDETVTLADEIAWSMLLEGRGISPSAYGRLLRAITDGHTCDTDGFPAPQERST